MIKFTARHSINQETKYHINPYQAQLCKAIHCNLSLLYTSG